MNVYSCYAFSSSIVLSRALDSFQRVKDPLDAKGVSFLHPLGIYAFFFYIKYFLITF